jgi:3'(2'), 5'-bisphosphate nucleotidase
MVSRAALDRMTTIVRNAGRAILQSSRTDIDVKPDGSPVTAADRAAEHSIRADLLAWQPDVPIVSEETSAAPFEARRNWPRFWLVDPLDGTKEFLAGRSEYTVNVALIEHGQPVMGTVLAPALDLLYVAGRGEGAWKQVASGTPQRIYSAPVPPGAPLVVVESRSHPSARLEAFLKTIPVERRVQAGSSLKFCWVAEGAADLYPRFGRTMEWDTAAGDCVYRQSGRDRERWSPLRYNTPSLAHDTFVIGLAGPDAMPAAEARP